MADPSVHSLPRSPPPPPTPQHNEPLYGGYTRFDLELEFITLLSSPPYLTHLASEKLLSNPEFINYLSYLRYWTRPEYIKYLTHPGPSLKALELLQEERFRSDVGGLAGVVGGAWAKAGR